MSKRSTPKQINRRYHTSMKAVTKGAYEQEILDALTNGKNTYLRVDRQESSSFDNKWIDVIEGVIFDLGEIVQNPRLFTRTEGAIVPVELARKTNAESVQHLASHTQYIKEIDESGNVVPSKIMTILHEDDIKTYENRFIATFIRRLVLFVEKRYEVVAKMAELHDEELLMVKNKSFIDGCDVEVETKVKISHPHEDAQSIKTNAYIARIEQMRNYILYFYNSQFMHQLRTEKDVHKPILQTNIIRKNPKYHHCYEVFKFIEAYSSMGVAYKVDENFSVFNDEEMKEINRTLFANYVTLRGKDRSKEAKGSSKVYKPKILTSIDDEQFVYGKQLAGPFEFVRVDPLYREYLASKVRNDLPLHPTKRDREYYEDEYAFKNEVKQDEKQLDNLLSRINKDASKFQKQIEKMEIEREQARLALEKRQQEVIDAEEEQLLEEAREDIVNAALLDEQERLAREAEERAKFLATIKPAEEPVPMSHPYTRPVTFAQACVDLWPILEWPQSRHIYREDPIVRLPELPKPIVIPEEEVFIHNDAEPLTFDEAAERIWPQYSQEVDHEFNKEEEIVYLPPKIIEEEPVHHSDAEPLNFEQAATRIWPQYASDADHKFNEQEELVYLPPLPREEEPLVHEDAEELSFDEAASKIWPQYNEEADHDFNEQEELVRLPDLEPEPEPVIEEQPAPVEEMVAEEPQEEPVIEEAAPVEEPVEESQEPEPELVVVEEKPKKNIPGLYVVLTKEGYYVRKNKHVASPYEAKIFDNYRQARGLARFRHGKVIMLTSIPSHLIPKEEEKPVEQAPVMEEPQVQPVEEPVVEEPAPVIEPVVEEPQEEEPVIESEPAPVPAEEPQEEPAVEEPQEEPAPIAEEPQPQVEEEIEEEQPAARKKIIGRFVVNTREGYYLSNGNYVKRMRDAYVFKDYRSAQVVAKAEGGRVVKL